MYSNHTHTRGISRFPELLDSLKSEYDALTQEANLHKARADECERKCMSISF